MTACHHEPSPGSCTHAPSCLQGKTSPPEHLTEAELIGLMEQHGIGTDASIAVHVNNVCERNYVRIESGRRVVPTELGITLISGYQRIDPELCRPQARPRLAAVMFSCQVETQGRMASCVQHCTAACSRWCTGKLILTLHGPVTIYTLHRALSCSTHFNAPVCILDALIVESRRWLQVRAHVEQQIALVAEGKADKAAVVEHTLQQFLQKFLFFVLHISRMDSLFEASFSPLSASGAHSSLIIISRMGG